MIFKLLQYTIKCLFLPIQKATVMIHILLLLIDLQKWYKLIEIIINIFNFAETIFNIVICHHGFLNLIITNKYAFYLLEI